MFSVAAVALMTVASAAFAGPSGKEVKPVVAASEDWKPAWLTDLSLRVGESYDSNIYASGAGEEFYPAVLPDGPIAWRNKKSAITTITPSIGVDLAKVFGKDSFIKTFSIGYSPDILFFHSAHDEDYVAHSLKTTIKAKFDNVTLSITNAFTYIDGNDEGLIYPGGNSSFANGTVRERRQQWQDRLKAFVKIDFGPVFVRPVTSLRYFDLDTEFSTVANYTNYIDRYELNGGLDVGYYVAKDLAVTLGYRYGHQFQDTNPLSTSLVNGSNDYQRVLVGVEGNVFQWLKLEAAVGPQFTHYTDDRPYEYGVAAKGRIDRNPVDVYAEVSATAKITKADALVLKYTHGDWLSSTGTNPLADTLYSAVYKHKFSKKLQGELGFRAANSNYHPASPRNDWDFVYSAGLKYAITENLTWDGAYSFEKAHNEQTYLFTKPGSTRQFERHVVSTGLTWAF